MIQEENIYISCKVCKNNIVEGAKKCAHCGSYQGRLRYLGIGNTTLSLIIALISVSVMLIPVIDNVWIESENVHGEIINLRNGENILLFITNSGEEPAIMSPYIDILVKEEKNTTVYAILKKDSTENNTKRNDSNQLIITPKDIQVFSVVPYSSNSLMFRTPIDSFYPEEDLEKNCRLKFTVINMKGHKRTENLDFHCYTWDR